MYIPKSQSSLIINSIWSDWKKNYTRIMRHMPSTVGPRITLLMVPEKCVVMRNSTMRITTYRH